MVFIYIYSIYDMVYTSIIFSNMVCEIPYRRLRGYTSWNFFIGSIYCFHSSIHHISHTLGHIKFRIMKEELIEIATKKGFSSNVIGKSVGSIYSTKDFYYLWMCELQKWLRKVHDNEVFAKSEYKNLKKAT